MIEEAVAQDAWSALVQRLETAKMVEQLALNSAFVRQGDQISLTLRPSHAHLHNEKAQQELEQALNHVLGEACSLNITVGQEGETPLSCVNGSTSRNSLLRCTVYKLIPTCSLLSVDLMHSSIATAYDPFNWG